MKTLYVLRHAKSSWDHPELDDHARPLNARGQRDARALAAHLAGVAQPDRILCSTARRTRETLGLVLPAFNDELEIYIEPTLYLASSGALLRLTQATSEPCERLMVIAHNDGIHEFAQRLCGGGGDAESLSRLRSKFPTCAFARITFDVEHWGQIGWGRGHLAAYITPKDLV